MMKAWHDVWPFVLMAVGLVGVFSASLFWAGTGRHAAPRGQGLWLVLAVPLAVGVLYALRGEPRALVAAPASPTHASVDMNQAVQGLAERLLSHPEDLDGWLMLARTYNTLGRYADAASAYERAASRAQQSPELLVDWIETRLLAANRRFDARTHELIDRATALAPETPEVLLLRVLAALDRGDNATAMPLMRTLREHYPPDSPDREAIDAALAEMAQGKAPRIAPPSAGRP